MESSVNRNRIRVPLPGGGQYTSPLTRIDWQLLADAVHYYEYEGFEYVEVPYFVPDQIAAKTFEGNGLLIAGTRNTLVGSAEQSFLDVISQTGRYVAVTPCFRREPHYNELSQPHFMKVELFDNRPEANVDEMLRLCATFMARRCPDIEIVRTDIGFDIMLNGIEVGSYGERHFVDGACDLRWVYGTGLALPRFSLGRKRSGGSGFDPPPYLARAASPVSSNRSVPIQ